MHINIRQTINPILIEYNDKLIKSIQNSLNTFNKMLGMLFRLIGVADFLAIGEIK
jgi:hypothetical protein